MIIGDDRVVLLRMISHTGDADRCWTRLAETCAFSLPITCDILSIVKSPLNRIGARVLFQGSSFWTVRIGYLYSCMRIQSVGRYKIEGGSVWNHSVQIEGKGPTAFAPVVWGVDLYLMTRGPYYLNVSKRKSVVSLLQRF